MRFWQIGFSTVQSQNCPPQHPGPPFLWQIQQHPNYVCGHHGKRHLVNLYMLWACINVLQPHFGSLASCLVWHNWISNQNQNRSHHHSKHVLIIQDIRRVYMWLGTDHCYRFYKNYGIERPERLDLWTLLLELQRLHIPMYLFLKTCHVKQGLGVVIHCLTLRSWTLSNVCNG